MDWSICAASRMMPDCALDVLMTWHVFRMDVWAAILHIERTGTGTTAAFAMTDQEAKVLLAVVPTTFRWGTGIDCGYSLKQKLAKFLRGERDDADNKDANATKDATKDQAGD